MKIKIACMQMKSSLGDKKENLHKIMKYIEQITEDKDVSLIVFPELALNGYECSELYERTAESFPDGDSIQTLCKAARDHNVHLIFGFVEQGEKDGKPCLYNSAAFVDNEGTAIGCYRKSHLVEGEETSFFEKGMEYPVFDTKIGKVGIMICWDTAFPEVARIMAIKGAQIIAVPAAWENPKGDDWDIVQSARSFDNVLYVASCNHVGRDRDLSFFGKSKIVGPLGKTISQAEEEETAVMAEVDLSILNELRNGYYALLKDRNPETYGDILSK